MLIVNIIQAYFLDQKVMFENLPRFHDSDDSSLQIEFSVLFDGIVSLFYLLLNLFDTSNCDAEFGSFVRITYIQMNKILFLKSLKKNSR